MLRSLLDPLLSVVYPQRCHVCGGTVGSARDGVACRVCWQSTRLFTSSDPLCRRCGAVLNENRDTCPNCLDASFDSAIAVGVYERALAANIVHLKKVPHLPGRIAACLGERLAEIGVDGDAVILPVPLSKRRLVERGFNQAEIVAQVAARVTAFPVVSNCLIRETHTPMHRMAMDKKARDLTVRAAFKIRAPRLIAGRSIVLIDDVLTSGSTASACARELKKNGAASVTVVTLARAVMYK